MIKKLTLAIAVTTLAMITASVKAELGETPAQMEPRKPDSVIPFKDGYTMTWIGKTVTHVGYFINGKACSETFQFTDRRPLTDADVARFMHPYQSLTHYSGWQQWQLGLFMNLSDRDDRPRAVAWHAPTPINALTIMTPDLWWSAYSKINASSTGN
jgi:hypothetical protein